MRFYGVNGQKLQKIITISKQNIGKKIDNSGNDSYNANNKSNKEVRKQYVSKVSSIKDSIDTSLPM